MTEIKWRALLTASGVAQATAQTWAPIFEAEMRDEAFSSGSREWPDFLATILHESAMLERLEEDLYYKTPGRIMATWPTRFKSLADEAPYMRNPQKLANRVYGGRMGNVGPDDGWRNRGSGLIQITGADNLRAIQKATGIPVFDNPELLRQPTRECLRCCIAWWEGKVPDAIMGDVAAIRRRVNGGTVGLDKVRVLADKLRKTLT